MTRAPHIAVTVLAAFLALEPSRASSEGERYQVRAAQVDGDWRCSLYADRAPLHEVLGALARQCGVALEGFERISRTALVDADLRDRPVRQVLEYVLGSVGLCLDSRVGAWHVREAARAPATADELREQALSAYVAAQHDFPDHPAGARALLSQGEIELARGHLAAAHECFDGVVAGFPQALEVAEALLRAGRTLAQLGEWEQAAGRFAELLRLEIQHPYEASARLALARCMVELGSSERALTMLDALDSAQPASGPGEVSERQVVRARALIASAKHQAALDLLANLEAQALEHVLYLETLELSAQALEGAGRPGDAARRWLLYGEEVEGSEHTIALRHAARLALEAGDEVAVLFIHELAVADGVEGETSPQVQEARERLGLATERPATATAALRLDQAEELLAQGRIREALEVVAGLERSGLASAGPARLRLVLAKARALAGVQGVDAALFALRDAVPTLDDPQARRAIYLVAGELLEEAGRVDEAIEAYQGRL